jgi:membrane-bound lytic murein transglycosylase A
MRNYLILFISTFVLSATIFTLTKEPKHSKSGIIVLDSLIHDTDALQLVASGKDSKSRIFRQLYTKTDSFLLPNPHGKLVQAAENQLTLLKKQPHSQSFGDLKVSALDLEEVVKIFQEGHSPEKLTSALDAYQLCGSDRRGNIKFTGYYSPVIAARYKQDAVFKFPVYWSKDGAQAKKSDDGFSVAYVRDRHEIRSITVEGAAFLQFPDGQRHLVAYDSEQKFMAEDVETGTEAILADTESPVEAPKAVFTKHNVFVSKEKAKPVGVGKIPLTTDFSIAVDANYIPLGSVLLAEVPILDETGKLIRKELRYVLAQDIGGAIKGSGHIDLYMGEGEIAKKKIQYMNKFGKIWLLLPKKKASKMVAQKL